MIGGRTEGGRSDMIKIIIIAFIWIVLIILVARWFHVCKRRRE